MPMIGWVILGVLLIAIALYAFSVMSKTPTDYTASKAAGGGGPGIRTDVVAAARDVPSSFLPE